MSSCVSYLCFSEFYKISMVSILPSHLSKKLEQPASAAPGTLTAPAPGAVLSAPRLPDLWALGTCTFPCHGDPASRFLGYPTSGDVSVHRLQVHGGGPVAGVSGCGVVGTRGQPGTLRRWQELCPCPSAVRLLSRLHLMRCKQRGCDACSGGGADGAGLADTQAVSWRPRVSSGQCCAKCLTTSSLLKQNQLPQ